MFLSGGGAWRRGPWQERDSLERNHSASVRADKYPTLMFPVLLCFIVLVLNRIMVSLNSACWVQFFAFTIANDTLNAFGLAGRHLCNSCFKKAKWNKLVQHVPNLAESTEFVRKMPSRTNSGRTVFWLCQHVPFLPAITPKFAPFAGENGMCCPLRNTMQHIPIWSTNGPVLGSFVDEIGTCCQCPKRVRPEFVRSSSGRHFSGRTLPTCSVK